MTEATRLPRLCRGLVVVPDADALLVDGSIRRRRLSGKTATSLLPRLVPLLDGTRDLPAIATAAEVDPATIERLIAVLDDCDLLEWPGDQSAATPGAADHVTAYFSRTISAIADVSCTEELASALGGAAALLIADDPIAAAVAEDLAESGVGDVSVYDSAQRVTTEDLARLAQAPRRLVAVLDKGGQTLADTVALTCGNEIPVLRFAGSTDITEIGPVFYHGWTPCVSCFRAGYANVCGGDVEVPVLSGLTAALVTAEIMMSLAHVATSSRPWRMTRMTSTGWRTESFDMMPGIGCPTCGHAPPPADAGTAGALALAYEWQHEARPDVLRAPQIRTRARLRRIAALQYDRDPFPPAPACELDDELTGGAALVAELLARTAGRRKPASEHPMDRWAPSGGNLGSVQLYAATERDLFGLPGTIFRYDDLGHRVLPVRVDRVPPESLLPAIDAGLDPCDVVLIFVASVSRISRKYEDFALRLSHLDAGCAALQLCVAAADRNVPVSFVSAWSPRVAELLELEPDGEIVTAVAILHGSGLEGAASCP